jgi:hypothetical protein
MARGAQHRDRRVQRLPCRKLVVYGAVSAIAGLYLFGPRKFGGERNTNIADRFAMASAETNPPANPSTAFEPSDWEFKPIILIYAGILILLVVSVLVLIPAYPDALPDIDRTLHVNPPGPRLQTDPEADYRRFHAHEEQLLNGYHWVDKRGGVVRVPIEQAMKKLVQTGISGFPKAPQ